MDRRQATVVEWVALQLIFDVFARDPWWRQAAAKKHLKVTVEEILEATRVRQRQESGRCGGSEGGLEGRITDIEG